MDKHKRLYELLPEGARPKSLYYSDGQESFMRPANFINSSTGNVVKAGISVGDDEGVKQLIEHAAMVWLMGRATEQNTALSMTCHELNGSNYQIMFGCLWAVDGATLIDALLAAAEHARQSDEETKK